MIMDGPDVRYVEAILLGVFIRAQMSALACEAEIIARSEPPVLIRSGHKQTEASGPEAD